MKRVSFVPTNIQDQLSFIIKKIDKYDKWYEYCEQVIDTKTEQVNVYVE